MQGFGEVAGQCLIGAVVVALVGPAEPGVPRAAGRDHVPEFGEAVEEAKQAGVDILYLQTKVEPCRLQISAEGKLSAYK